MRRMNKSAINIGFGTLLAAAFAFQAAGCSPPGTDDRPKVTSDKPVRVLKPEDVKITLGNPPTTQPASEAGAADSAEGSAEAAPASESTNTP